VVERESSVGRWVVSLLAGLVLAAGGLFVVVALRLLGSEVCGADPTPTVLDCERRLVRTAWVAGLSMTFAALAVLVAFRARTAEMVWKGGLVLVFCAVVPLFVG